MSEEMSAVITAEKVAADLEDRRRQLLERKIEIDDERRRLSYLAVAEKNPAAVKALAALAVEANKHTHELESLLAAAAEADQRLAAARAAEAQAADRDNALALRAALREFVEAGESLSEALEAISDEGKAVFDAAKKMRELGCQFPTSAQIQVLGLAAVQTALMSSPWAKAFPFLAPRDRKSWGVLVREWASRIEANDIAPRLGEQAKATEVAA
jgi:hypothetical protein